MLMVTLVTAVMKAGKGKGQQQRQAAAAELDSGCGCTGSFRARWEGGNVNGILANPLPSLYRNSMVAEGSFLRLFAGLANISCCLPFCIQKF